MVSIDFSHDRRRLLQDPFNPALREAGSFEFVDVMRQVLTQYNVAVHQFVLFARRKGSKTGNRKQAGGLDHIFQIARFRIVPGDKVQACASPVGNGIVAEPGIGE